MPENNTSEVKCEKCDCVINDDVYSNSEHEVLCLGCFEDYAACNDCGETVDTADNDVTELHDHHYCSDCSSDNITHCEQTGNALHLERDQYYEHDGYIYSSQGAYEATGYECDSCGHCVSVRETIDNESEDHVADALCYDCYENRQSQHYLTDEPSRGIKRIIKLDERYTSLYGPYAPKAEKEQAKAAADWLRRLYGSRLDNFGHYNSMIIKGGNPQEPDKFGWWQTTIKIRSNLNEEIESWLKRFIQEDELVVPHKKLGTYHPFRDFFGAYIDCSVENIVMGDNGEEVDKFRSPFNGYPGEDVNYYIESLHSRPLRNTIDNNRLRVKGAVGKLRLTRMKKALNKIITKNLEHLTEFYPNRIKAFMDSWEKYLTNSVYIELPVKIGFEPAIQKDVEQFNYDVQSCQSSRYVDTLAHGFADMLVNPHLYILIMNPKDENEIIGRSILRVWRKPFKTTDGGVDLSDTYKKDFANKCSFVAPSRLYLQQYTHAKSEVYANLFVAVDEWAKEMYDEHVLVAYGKSRHDSSSTAEYIRNSNLLRPIEVDALKQYYKRQDDGTYNENPLVTDWWMPFWRGCPAEEGDYIYYNDEYQHREFVFCQQSDMNQDIAVREKLGDFIAVEVNIEQ